MNLNPKALSTLNNSVTLLVDHHGLDTRRVWLRSDFSMKAKKEKKREKIEYDIRHTPSGQSRVYRVTQLGTDSMAFTPESPLTKGQ